jgi:hypothetical protein
MNLEVRWVPALPFRLKGFPGPAISDHPRSLPFLGSKPGGRDWFLGLASFSPDAGFVQRSVLFVGDFAAHPQHRGA